MLNILPEEIIIGGSFIFNDIKINLSIPKGQFRGISYAYDNTNQTVLTELLEYSVLNLVNKIGLENSKIHIIDFNISSKYFNLYKLRNKNGIVNLMDVKEFSNSLEAIENYVTEVNDEYLQNQYTSICNYNLKNNEELLDYNILVLNLDYLESLSQNDYISLNKLLIDGKKFGVNFFIQFNAENFAKEIIESNNNKSFHNNRRLNFLETIQQQTAVLYKHNSNYKMQNVEEKIAKAFSKFKYEPKITEMDNLIKNLENELKSVDDKVSNKDFVSVLIGKKGKKEYYFEMGAKSVNYHGFIGGQTGMGKSNLINNIIVKIAKKYTPDELRLQLIDLKASGGTEFQLFKNHPNVEKLVLSSKPEISIKVIEDFEKEINTRSEIIKKLEVKNIYEFNKISPTKLPFKLMIIDEVQKLFINGSKITNQFNNSLERIVREGRSYGIHILISTQSLSEVNISKPILEQINLRISFKLNSYSECIKIMNTDNDLPTLIEPYEVVYNSSSGNKKFNKKFLTLEIETNTIKPSLEKAKTLHGITISNEIFDNNYVFDDEKLNIKSKNETNTQNKFFKPKNKEVNLDNY